MDWMIFLYTLGAVVGYYIAGTLFLMFLAYIDAEPHGYDAGFAMGMIRLFLPIAIAAYIFVAICSVIGNSSERAVKRGRNLRKPKSAKPKKHEEGL